MSQLNTVWSPMNLPSDDNVPDNNYSFCIDLNQPWFMSKGAMIAYYGQMQFTALTQGLRDFFGAHTYRRTDRDGVFHTLWSGDRSEVSAD